MKNLLKFGTVVILLITVSCSSTKKVVDNSARDGSSFEKALVVNSVSEEYKYVRSVCQDCQFIRQSLVFEKQKPYDILEFRRSNGEEISYYFDISKFFGKGF